jgi:hypothetical protein
MAAPGERSAIELVNTLLTEKGAALLQAHPLDARCVCAGESIADWQVETVQSDQARLHLDGEAKFWSSGPIWSSRLGRLRKRSPGVLRGAHTGTIKLRRHTKRMGRL